MTTPVGPDFIALQVRSLARSSKFYMEVFGFEAAAQSPPSAVVLKTAPIPLALREPLRPLPEAGPLGVGMVLWIACDDAEALHNLIVKRGGAILSRLPTVPSVASSLPVTPMATRSPFTRRGADRMLRSEFGAYRATIQ